MTHPCTKNQIFSLKFAPFWRKFRKILKSWPIKVPNLRHFGANFRKFWKKKPIKVPCFWKKRDPLMYLAAWFCYPCLRHIPITTFVLSTPPGSCHWKTPCLRWFVALVRHSDIWVPPPPGPVATASWSSGESTPQLFNFVVAPVGVAAAYPYRHSNLVVTTVVLHYMRPRLHSWSEGNLYVYMWNIAPSLDTKFLLLYSLQGFVHYCVPQKERVWRNQWSYLKMCPPCVRFYFWLNMSTTLGSLCKKIL